MSGLFWSHCSIALGFPNPWLEEDAEDDGESIRLQDCWALAFMSVVVLYLFQLTCTVGKEF